MIAPHHPHFKPAILAPDGAFSAKDLDDAAARVAAGLLGETIDLAEQRVAFVSAPSFAHLAVARGIWRAGGISVPLALAHPSAELEYVIRDANASIVVVDPDRATAIAPIVAAAGARLELTPALLQNEHRHAGTAMSPERRALILYTSGTTGRPKGVVTTHGNIAAQVGSLVEAWEWSARDRTLLVLPLHHVHGIINVVGCARAVEATLEIHTHFDAATTWDRLASGDITVFTAVPTIYHRLIQAWETASSDVQRARSEGCRRMRLMMSGSAALPVQILEKWKAITGHTLLERYGMTEIGMALSNPLHGTRRPGSVGSPLPGVHAQVVDDTGAIVTEGTAGELEIQGPAVFHEYWRRPDETRDAFRDGWFRTGDVAVVEDGAYRLLGRNSVDILKTGGYKVSALEIEEVLRRHPAVADCAIVGVPDVEWGDRVCAAVELRSACTLTLAELQTWMKNELAPYKVPKDLRCLPALPRNVMGKVVKPDVAGLFVAK